MVMDVFLFYVVFLSCGGLVCLKVGGEVRQDHDVEGDSFEDQSVDLGHLFEDNSEMVRYSIPGTNESEGRSDLLKVPFPDTGT